MWVDYGWIKAIYGWFVCEPGGEVTIRGRDHRNPSRWESLNNQLASHTGVSLENQSGPSCHISKPVCKLHRCQLELTATLLCTRPQRSYMSNQPLLLLSYNFAN